MRQRENRNLKVYYFIEVLLQLTRDLNHWKRNY